MTKLILSVFMILAVSKSNGQKLQILIMTEAESRRAKFIYKDTSGRIHYHFNCKDSIISKFFAKKIIAKWKFDAVPKKIT